MSAKRPSDMTQDALVREIAALQKSIGARMIDIATEHDTAVRDLRTSLHPGRDTDITLSEHHHPVRDRAPSAHERLKNAQALDGLRASVGVLADLYRALFPGQSVVLFKSLRDSWSVSIDFLDTLQVCDTRFATELRRVVRVFRAHDGKDIRHWIMIPGDANSGEDPDLPLHEAPFFAPGAASAVARAVFADASLEERRAGDLEVVMPSPIAEILRLAPCERDAGIIRDIPASWPDARLAELAPLLEAASPLRAAEALPHDLRLRLAIRHDRTHDVTLSNTHGLAADDIADARDLADGLVRAALDLHDGLHAAVDSIGAESMPVEIALDMEGGAPDSSHCRITVDRHDVFAADLDCGDDLVSCVRAALEHCALHARTGAIFGARARRFLVRHEGHYRLVAADSPQALRRLYGDLPDAVYEAVFLTTTERRALVAPANAILGVTPEAA